MPPSAQKPIWRFESFTLDTTRQTLTRGDEVLPLRPQSFDVLTYLVEHAGELVTKDELLEKVWAGRVVSEDSVSHCLSEIRSVLGDTEKTLIRTLPRRGVILETVVTRSEEPVAKDSITGNTETRNTQRWPLLAGLVTLAALLLVWKFMPGPVSVDPAEPVQVAPTTRPTLAVLPFADLSPGGNHEHMADGMADELILQLSQLEGLLVTGRTSAFQFKNRTVGLQEVGEILGVEHVLEGSIRSSEDTLRVTAQLVRTDNGFPLWSDSYDRPLTDVFTIQDEIADNVVSALRVTLGLGGRGSPYATKNIEAYELAIQSMQAQWNDSTPEQRRMALEQLKKATELDPDYAFAWAMMAVYYVFNQEEIAENWYELSQSSMARANQLDPGAEWVRQFEVWVYVGLSDWASAHRALETLNQDVLTNEVANTALELNLKTGRVHDAVNLAERALRRDPLNTNIRNTAQHAFVLAGRTEDALAQSEWIFHRGEGLAVQSVNEGLVTAMMHPDEQVLKLWLERRLQSPSEMGVHEAMAERLGNPEAALEWLRAFESEVPNYYYNAQAWAAYLGDAGLALEFLAKYPDPWAMWTPLNAEVRQLPGFKQILRDVGLVDYWREFGWNDFCRPLGTDDFICQ